MNQLNKDNRYRFYIQTYPIPGQAEAERSGKQEAIVEVPCVSLRTIAEDVAAGIRNKISLIQQRRTDRSGDAFGK